MFNQLKNIKHVLLSEKVIRGAYLNDYKEYCRWQYHNPEVKTKNALEAKILRQTHVIEKGMSLSKPKERFGMQKASDLLDFVIEYIELGYSILDSTPVKNALGVIDAYLTFHKERGFIPSEIVEKFEQVKKYTPKAQEPFGIRKVMLCDLEKDIHGEFPCFFYSRHSVRQFSEKELKLDDIKKSVELAMQAPSACNRQSCKVYFYQDKEINTALGSLIAGNTGFEGEVPNYLIVTSDMSAFYDAFERNQVYVDGGIFALALTEALHYYGIASCILQNGEFVERNKQFKAICGNIPENEKIILFIAIGYYKHEFSYASSHRKTLGEVLNIK